MIERRALPWLAGLVAMIFAMAGLGFWLLWTAAGIQVQVNKFFSSQVGDQQLSEDIYRYWDRLSTNSYTLSQLATPILAACVIAIFALLAVLARWWDVTRRQTTAQDDAAAAS